MKDTLPDRVRIGVFEVNLRAGELRQGQRTICLQEQGLFVLRLLVEQAGEIVTRDELKQKLWPNDTVVDFDHGINTVIRRLRVALGDSADQPQYIETVARRGYRLLVPVERIQSSTEEPSSSSDSGVLVAAGGAAERRARTQTASLIGKRVSHYRVLNVIGGGGMGLVYEAEDLKLGRRVALKFLPEELADNAVALQRFEREAKTASSLNHPCICTIHEIEEHENQPFMVMELLEGESLRDRLASVTSSGRTLALNKLLDIAVHICEGLQAAHSKGIIHRDIKPANIFLTTSGQVKILDFGLAKLMEAGEEDQATEAAAGAGPGDVLRVISSAKMTPGSPADPTLTRTGLAMGTAGYMSPEQVRGEKLDARTDLFSFGLVLYEMTTGQRPFTAETASVGQDTNLNQTPVPVRERNPNIPPKLENIVNRAIEMDRERRYQSAGELAVDLERLAHPSLDSDEGESPRRVRWKWFAATAVLCLAIIAAGLYWRLHRRPKLTERDTIVIADFENKTGDPVFDDTLKQALTIQLEQSPFFNLLSSRKIRETLKLMNRSAAEPMTEAVTREICQRTSSQAILTGSIAELGSQYVLGLNAVDCNMGDSLAVVQERAANKDGVLKALDAASVSLRNELGESLSSVEKYDTPLSEATTPSLEALKAFSLGTKVEHTQGATAALPYLLRAVEIDPNFASAFQRLAVLYINLNEGTLAAEYERKAYHLRDKVSERERFAIEAYYYWHVTGELERAAQVYERWQQIYPRDAAPVGNLGGVYANLGNMQKFLEQFRSALRLEPNYYVIYADLGAGYMNLNRLDDAEQAFKEAERRGLAAEILLQFWYQLDFLRGDSTGMAQMIAAASGKPGTEDLMLATQADTEAWHGRFNKARQLTQRAVDSAKRNDAKESAANYEAAAALREAPAGNRWQARANADMASRSSGGRDVNAISALALAEAGDIDSAQKLAAELNKGFPLDTLAQRYWLPAIHAAIALQRNDANSAIQVLNGMGTLDLAAVNSGINIFLCPAYVRGQAYLMLHDGKAAATEFQKFIDHYGLITNSPWGALARLGVARGYALEAQTDSAARDKARTAYQNFLTIWKDADPDIPIYKQAKAEYAKLQ